MTFLVEQFLNRFFYLIPSSYVSKSKTKQHRSPSGISIPKTENYSGPFLLSSFPKALYEKNIEVAYYESGHMMYLHLPSLEKLKKDVKAFIERN